MEIGALGRSRSSRVDDDDAPAAATDRIEPAGPVGRGREAAVRLERVGAEQQQEVGAVDVGHRDRERMAEDEPAGDVLRHLVDGRGRVDVPRSERLDERPDRERVREVVRVRVADVDRDGIRAVLRHDRREPSLDLGEGLVPARLLVDSVAAHERPAEAVGIVVERAERRSLRADEPLRERVVVVAADPRDASVLDLDAQPAGGLAEGARPERDPGRHGMTIQLRPNRASIPPWRTTEGRSRQTISSPRPGGRSCGSHPRRRSRGSSREPSWSTSGRSASGSVMESSRARSTCRVPCSSGGPTSRAPGGTRA